MATEAALNLRSLSRVISEIRWVKRFNSSSVHDQDRDTRTRMMPFIYEMAMGLFAGSEVFEDDDDPRNHELQDREERFAYQCERLQVCFRVWRRRAIRRLYQRYLDAYAEWLACHIVQYMLWGARACTPLAFVQPPVCCPA